MGARVTIYNMQAIREAYRASTPGRVEVAHQAAAVAGTTAPVDTGEFQQGVGVEVDGDHVQIVNTDPEAGYKEYGTVDTPAHSTMTDAARQFGRYTGVTPRG